MRGGFLLLKFAVLDFLDDREFKNVTPKTLQSYRDILKQFEDFCLEHDVINVENITTSIMKRYILHYQKKGNNATTINFRLQRIPAFLNYMIESKVIKNNPAKKIQKAREDVRIDVFTNYHIKQMLNYYFSNSEGLIITLDLSSFKTDENPHISHKSINKMITL